MNDTSGLQGGKLPGHGASCSSQDRAASVFRSQSRVWVEWGDPGAPCSTTSLCKSDASPLRQQILNKISSMRPSCLCRDHIHLYIFATSLALVTAQDGFLLLSVPFIKRPLSPTAVLPAAPLRPQASPFSQLSLCLFASPTSLSTSFILTFKSFQACSEMPQNCLCYLRASEC